MNTAELPKTVPVLEKAGRAVISAFNTTARFFHFEFFKLYEDKNAGSIFLGRNVPEALGDYFAGPNHTLPTSGTARFSSPLGVDDFVKKSSFLYYTRDALEAVAPRIADFAEREGLHAHARSVTIRYE